jgi:hypothetical protein
LFLGFFAKYAKRQRGDLQSVGFVIYFSPLSAQFKKKREQDVYSPRIGRRAAVVSREIRKLNHGATRQQPVFIVIGLGCGVESLPAS